MKYSIVIPHWKGWEDLLKPCLQSLVKNTSTATLASTEFVVVLNGSKDGDLLKAFANEAGINLKMIEFPEPIGYTKATNTGIRESSGEFVVLLNNDCCILDYMPQDEWLKILEAPFADEKVACTGVKKIFSQHAKSSFLVFFLVMIRRSVFDVVGMLDEAFTPGGGEDIDFCLRLKKYGLKGVKVPNDDEDYMGETSYPVYHAAEKSVFDVPGWEEGFWRRMSVIEKRVNQFKYEKFADVTAYVSTKGRYQTTLPSCLAAIANQTLLPKKLIIFQDDPDAFNMQESSVYRNLLYGLMQSKGIQWSVIYGEGKGQVLNHQKALTLADTEWLWRVDDDNIPEPNVLEGLCGHIDAGVGAVGSAVVDPTYVTTSGFVSPRIEHVKISPNVQWNRSNKVIDVDHLYSTFLYRKAAGAHGYCQELSKVGHTEETLFTYEMKRNGWKLIADTSLMTWHLRESTGGIRSFSDHSLWKSDDEVFARKMKEWGVSLTGVIQVALNSGMGDHWMFKSILERIVNKNSSSQVFCACCYPAVFEDLVKKYDNLKLISIEDGNNMFGKEKMEELSVYAYCDKVGWTGKHVSGAMEKMYEQYI